MEMSSNRQHCAPCYGPSAMQDGHEQGTPDLAQSHVEEPLQMLQVPEYRDPSSTTCYSQCSSSQHSWAWAYPLEVSNGVQTFDQDHADPFDHSVMPGVTEISAFAPSTVPVTSMINPYNLITDLHLPPMSSYDSTLHPPHSFPSSPLPADCESNSQAASTPVSSTAVGTRDDYSHCYPWLSVEPSSSQWQSQTRPHRTPLYTFPELQQTLPTYRNASVQAPGSPTQAPSESFYSALHSSDMPLVGPVNGPLIPYASTISSYQSSTDQSMGSSAGSRPNAQSHATESSAAAVDRPTSVDDTSKNLWDQLQELYQDLISQYWLRENEPEPPITDADTLPNDPKIKRPIESRFDFFFEPNGSHECRWMEKGERCKKKSTRKDLAQDHVRKHFEYAPFRCDGSNCGTVGCSTPFRSRTRLDQHIKRARHSRTQCGICKKSVTTQNLARHMKQQHMGAKSSPTSA